MMGAPYRVQVQRSVYGSYVEIPTRKYDPLEGYAFHRCGLCRLQRHYCQGTGQRKLERIPVREAKPDRIPGDQKAWTPPDLVSVRLGKEPLHDSRSSSP